MKRVAEGNSLRLFIAIGGGEEGFCNEGIVCFGEVVVAVVSRLSNDLLCRVPASGWVGELLCTEFCPFRSITSGGQLALPEGRL